MVKPFGSHTADRRGRLDEMERALLAGSDDPLLIQAYHDRAVTSRQVGRARETFDILQKRLPHDQVLRSLSIALCLQEENYPAAMAGIERWIAGCKPDDDLIDAALAVRAKIGPRRIDPSGQDCETISLCMIVKDEVAGIGACLNAAKSLVDEIIVVDTGSKDRTADVARIFGARTHAFAWANDFAAARNYSLSKARGKWILILDADEIIAAKDHPALRRMIEDHGSLPAAFSIETRNYSYETNTVGWKSNDDSYQGYTAGMGWIGSRKVRLFPRRERIRFHFPVHEKVDPAIKAAGLPIVFCPVPVHHYGDLNALKKQKKAQTYFRLGYEKLGQLGNDRAALRELAVQAGQLEYWNEAIALWQRFLTMQPDFAEAYVNMAGACSQLAQYEKALQFAQRALRLDPDLKEAKFNVAVSLIFLGRASEAVTILRDAIRVHPDHLASHFMLAAALGCLGDGKGAWKAFWVLKSTPLAMGMSTTVAEFIQRLQKSGLHAYAQGVRAAAAEWRVNVS